MRRLILIGLVVLVPVVIMGCGGSSTSAGGDVFPAKGPEITQAPTMEQVTAAYAAAGKPVPDFLNEAVQPAAEPISTRSLMAALSMTYWSAYETLSRDRVSWFEANATSATHLYDAYVNTTSGDPDLFVFSPMRWTGTRLQLIGYSIADPGHDEHVGSFKTTRYGTGRYIIAVYAYSNCRYRVGYD